MVYLVTRLSLFSFITLLFTPLSQAQSTPIASQGHKLLQEALNTYPSKTFSLVPFHSKPQELKEVLQLHEESPLSPETLIKSQTIDHSSYLHTPYRSRNQEDIQSEVGFFTAKKYMQHHFSKSPNTNYNFEHIRPLSLKGDNEADNLAVTTQGANFIKAEIEKVYSSFIKSSDPLKKSLTLTFDTTVLKDSFDSDKSFMATDIHIMITAPFGTILDLHLNPLLIPSSLKSQNARDLKDFFTRLTLYMEYAVNNKLVFDPQLLKPAKKKLTPPQEKRAKAFLTPPVKPVQPSPRQLDTRSFFVLNDEPESCELPNSDTQSDTEVYVPHKNVRQKKKMSNHPRIKKTSVNVPRINFCSVCMGWIKSQLAIFSFR